VRLGLDFNKECFFIAPIGEVDSDVRKRSDGVRDWVVRPAARVYGLETLRADDVGEPGQITSQAIQHCLKAKAAVADLTGGNPNVYYELSIRHGAQLPVVLIAQKGTELPFDISQSRAIFFDHTDLTSAGEAREELQRQLAASLQGGTDNPISDGMRLAQLKSGNVEEKTLASLVEEVRTLGFKIERIETGAGISRRGSPPDLPPFFSRAERDALAKLDTVALEETRMTAAEVGQVAEVMLERAEALEAAKRDSSGPTPPASGP
jgi:hypothetical protein